MPSLRQRSNGRAITATGLPATPAPTPSARTPAIKTPAPRTSKGKNILKPVFTGIKKKGTGKKGPTSSPRPEAAAPSNLNLNDPAEKKIRIKLNGVPKNVPKKQIQLKLRLSERLFSSGQIKRFIEDSTFPYVMPSIESDP